MGRPNEIDNGGGGGGARPAEYPIGSGQAAPAPAKVLRRALSVKLICASIAAVRAGRTRALSSPLGARRGLELELAAAGEAAAAAARAEYHGRTNIDFHPTRRFPLAAIYIGPQQQQQPPTSSSAGSSQPPAAGRGCSAIRRRRTRTRSRASVSAVNSAPSPCCRRRVAQQHPSGAGASRRWK